MIYDLPTSINIDGNNYTIRNKADYRVVLDVLSVLNDEDLTEQEKAYCSLFIFYDEIPENTDEAIKQMYSFINCNEEEKATDKPQIMDWEQDFSILVAPINRTIGREIRSNEYLHWWTFMSAYMEIGECTFATIISIRNKKQKGIKLDKWEQDYYKEHREKVDLKNSISQKERELLENEW